MRYLGLLPCNDDLTTAAVPAVAAAVKAAVDQQPTQAPSKNCCCCAPILAAVLPELAAAIARITNSCRTYAELTVSNGSRNISEIFAQQL